MLAIHRMPVAFAMKMYGCVKHVSERMGSILEQVKETEKLIDLVGISIQFSLLI